MTEQQIDHITNLRNSKKEAERKVDLWKEEIKLAVRHCDHTLSNGKPAFVQRGGRQYGSDLYDCSICERQFLKLDGEMYRFG